MGVLAVVNWVVDLCTERKTKSKNPETSSYEMNNGAYSQA
jgi:hypothetical protein